MSNSGDRNSGNYNSGHHNSGYYNSGHHNSGSYNSGSYNSGDHNSGHHNSGHHNSGDHNSGHYNSGCYNSGYYNSGSYNSGDYNSGHHNSGLFNTDEPYVRCFNKETTVKLSDLIVYNKLSFTNYFSLTRWIPSNEMSQSEKREHPSHLTTGGFLKTFTYKEAWANLWAILPQEEKQKVFNLPNFCPKIFEEITGINVAVDPNKEKARELREKAEELLNQAKLLEKSIS